MITMYSVYVGHYKTPSESKKDLIKLNKLGYKGFLFSRGDYYSLKVFNSINQEKVEITRRKLSQEGFTTSVELQDVII